MAILLSTLKKVLKFVSFSDVLLHIANFLDSRSLLSLFQTCHWFKGLLEDFDPFWKNICVKEDFLNYDGLIRDDGDQVTIQLTYY